MTKSTLAPRQHMLRRAGSATLSGLAPVVATAAVAGSVTWVVSLPVAKVLESRLQSSRATAYLAATRGRG